ncbi:hypothetical protein HYU93_03455 [Candidatus Daviesbacteria bacterium]|nr:hypothetical protein [Candidatus Daviesbacteria bacterium]
MPIDPNIVRIALMIVVLGLLFLAFTYLIDFLRPILIAVVLIIIAYLIYRYLLTGTISL